MTDTTNTDLETGSGDAGFDDAFSEFSKGAADRQVGQPDTAQTPQQAPRPEAGQPATDDNPGAPAVDGSQVVDAGQNTHVEIDWSAVPPQYRAAFEAAQKQAEAGEQYRRSNEGRLTAHQMKIDRMEAELAALRAANGNADPNRASRANPDAIVTQVKAVTKDYPELAPFAEAVQALAESNRQAESRFAAMDAQTQQAALDRNAAELEKMHPGWLNDLSTPAFKQWFEAAPEFIQQAVRQNGDGIRDLNSAAYIVGLFKAQTAATQAPATPSNNAILRQQQQAGSAGVSATGRGGPSGPPNDFEAAFAHYAAGSR